MNVNLRHLHGPNLKLVEEEIERISKTIPLQIISINFKGSSWYVHYLIQGPPVDKLKKKTKVTKAKKTETIKEG